MNKRTNTISKSAKKRESIMRNRTRVSALSLRRRYGPHYQEVLAEHIEEDLAGERLRFKVMRPLPAKADYDQMLRNTFTKPVRDWVLEASDTFDELKQEHLTTLSNSRSAAVAGFAVAKVNKAQARLLTAQRQESIEAQA